ncbi:MAG: chorismate synthase [Patescibacteria group bacterium]
MAGNSFGKIFVVTSWGESHGKALGVVVDGCPAGIKITTEDIQREVDRRRPSGSKITTARQETDQVEILSGIFEDTTTGMPISMLVYNQDQHSKDYSSLKNVYRPGHADFTYDMKYGIRDYRGGGRSSGRETVSRVMAGAVAKKVLDQSKIKIFGHTIQVGNIQAEKFDHKEIEKNLMRCADKVAAEKMIKYVEKLRDEGDSSGAILEIIVKNMPVGLGEPCFDKLPADLAKAIFSIPTIKGVSFGTGFQGAGMKGSENNDVFQTIKGKVKTKTNHAGGTLGGISSGEDLVIQIAVKPPSSIAKKQQTVDSKKKKVEIEIRGRHDACLAPRVIPVAESMVAMTLVDHLLRSQAIKNTF